MLREYDHSAALQTWQCQRVQADIAYLHRARLQTSKGISSIFEWPREQLCISAYQEVPPRWNPGSDCRPLFDLSSFCLADHSRAALMRRS